MNELQEPFDLFGVECGKGWAILYDPLIELCKAEGVRIQQVKEKHGLLRFYVGAASPLVREEIAQAERASAFICEQCGEPGNRRNIAHRLATLCDTHAKSMEERRQHRGE